MSKQITIGISGRKKVHLDPAAMLASHMAVIASSGGGKSYLLRGILERTFGLFPHIVIDVEGELKTLREKFDYIIASADGEGDCAAHPRSAALLARRLLELNASCIVDIYELNAREQTEFVRSFLNALVKAPKKLWGPRLVVLDEAQLFAPENKGRGQESRDAVIDLLGRGRKRGLSTILASQRLSKVSKDAIGECRNKIYGFCNLPADRKRATDDLGFLAKADQQRFRELDTGEFYAVGPAISKREVIKFVADTVATTHPRPGEGIATHTPPPKAKVRKLIAELTDLPERAEAEIVDLAAAKAKIRELERTARAKRPAAPDTRALEQAEAQGRKQAEADIRRAEKHAQVLEGIIAKVRRAVEASTEPPEKATVVATVHTPEPRSPPVAPEKPGSNASNGSLPKGEEAVLIAIVQAPEGHASRSEITTMTGYRRSTRNTYLSRLSVGGFVQEFGTGRFEATETGRFAVAHANPLPLGPDLLTYHLSNLPPGEREILLCISKAYPGGLSRDDITTETEYARSSRNTYISRLTGRQLVSVNGSTVTASELLF